MVKNERKEKLMSSWKYIEKYNFWSKETPKSQSALYLLSPKQNFKDKWMVRSDRYTKRSPSGKGTFHEFKTKKQALDYIKKIIEK